MSAQFISVHPDNPQPRFIKQICECLNDGGVVVVPTDSAYALCCKLEQKHAMERIARIRQVDKHHNFTLLCRDLSELSTYAKVENNVFRLLKNHTPGAYTFRVPNNAIVSAIVSELNEPLMSCSLILPEHEEAESDPVTINDEIGSVVDVIVDGGLLSPSPTSVIVFNDGVPEVARYGSGDVSDFE